MNADAGLVIVGAGHAGGSLAALLRQYAYTGAITLLGDEPVAPYQRPPLSKAWLKGEVNAEALLLRPLPFYAQQQIDLRLHTSVTRIDAAQQRVQLADGTSVAYANLVLATGAEARRLPLGDAAWGNVLSLRDAADAERLRAALGPGKRLVVIGGGYVGLECAATARALGTEVVVIERAARLLERVASAPVSAFLHAFHQQRGVHIEVAAQIEAIEGRQRAEAVRLQDGRRFACDVVLVGVGAAPRDALARAAGLRCDDGVLVDADCRSSDPHIYAIGDVARRPHALYQRTLRLESVPSAQEQAKRVAAVLAGREPSAPEWPWFWSDQYELKLQIAGLPLEATETVVRGDPAQAKFAVFHLGGGKVHCVEAISSSADFMLGRKLIASGAVVDRERLRDASVPAKELAA
jgi:3-phenylpropionate/trans-cinnamate dioxygenase ferredoxin reductase subunit